MDRRHFIGAAATGVAAVGSGALPAEARRIQTTAPDEYFHNIKKPYDPYPGISVPGAVGNGTTDDTQVIASHLGQMAFWGDTRKLVFPPGRYRTTATITQPPGIQILGLGKPFVLSTEINDTHQVAVIQADHAGIAWTFNANGRAAGLEGMYFAGQPAANDVFSVVVPDGAGDVWIDRCSFWRRGKAALWVRPGAVRITNCRITTGHSSAPRGLFLPNGEPSGVGLWMQSCADGWVENLEIASGGPGLWVASNAGMHYVNIKVFNSWQGLVVNGTRMTVFDEFRIDEHDNEGVVWDWNSNGNRLSALVHNCGARIAQPSDRRVGLRLGSGSYNRFDVTFDNWDHAHTQEGGALNFSNPMQHGLVLRAFDLNPNTQTRPQPRYNRIEATYRNMQSTPIIDDSGAYPGGDTNVLVSMGV
ncbi:MAG: glycosyl hydrolase family 28-related protein [Nocardioidaceae bacterium]